MKIFHNPRCRKSRETLNLITEAGVEPEIVEYLRVPISAREISEILVKLDMKPLELIRKSEAIYKSNYKGKELTDEQWIQVMVENPILIERPIVIKGDKAVVGRPPENVNTLL